MRRTLPPREGYMAEQALFFEPEPVYTPMTNCDVIFLSSGPFSASAAGIPTGTKLRLVS